MRVGVQRGPCYEKFARHFSGGFLGGSGGDGGDGGGVQVIYHLKPGDNINVCICPTLSHCVQTPRRVYGFIWQRNIHGVTQTPQK